jgi:hypothetical protein
LKQVRFVYNYPYRKVEKSYFNVFFTDDTSNKQNLLELIFGWCYWCRVLVSRYSACTGDTLCDEAHPITLETMDFPAPVIGIAIEPEKLRKTLT